jgi:Macrocin-O-methyltransferase (TylF)
MWSLDLHGGMRRWAHVLRVRLGLTYEAWFESVFGEAIPAPTTRIGVSWPDNSKWGHRAHCALLDVEIDYVKDLLTDIKERSIPGALAEFGVFQGWWVSFLWEHTDAIGLDRAVYGFDSFAGLSKPHPRFDEPVWYEGQFACDLATVRTNVKAAERPRIRLVEGFFADSLPRAEAQSVESYCFARIDCDIYEPALQCLTYLGPRLSDGAILVFDDWPHQLGLGEQKAFQDWLPSVPHLKFEFLFYGTIGHFYLRVRHR